MLVPDPKKNPHLFIAVVADQLKISIKEAKRMKLAELIEMLEAQTHR